ncbi:hypothetical protein [Pyxidicoccus caerfyrddinensis]|uniref:hypothetical protein n=1 Tax=Pyxidicoccus caerfyrddinensis TaxID=2709663 RepID=UPI0013DD584A|nr:hypothetical protein [Pyxidicoccus caerfyrddinensis]
MSSTLESYELIRFAEAFEARLATAGEMIAGRPGLEAEKRWLADALELVRTSRAPSAGVLDRVKDLPELEEAREEYAFHQLGLWVDALEKLHAGITFTASSRAPVIEALFPHVKFPQLRRAPRDAIMEYATSYERRTKSSYVTRIFGREDFALVRPVMEQVAAAHAAWRSSHEPAPLSPEVETVLREELVSLGRKLDVALRQARLLSEAAMVPVPSVYEAAGLSLKPKRRAGRGLGPTADEAMAGFGDEPVDSMEPTEAELAEVAALDAGGDDGAVGAAAPVAGAHAQTGDARENAAELEADQAGTAAAAGSSADDAEVAVPAIGGAQDAAHAGEAPVPGSRADTSPSRESPAPGSEDSGSSSQSSEASAESGSEPQAEPRGARKGRKKAEAAPAPSEGEPTPQASTEAQAPRVRKKKGAPTPDASGSDTP